MIVGIMNHPSRSEPGWTSYIRENFESVIVYKEKHKTTRQVLIGLLKRILHERAHHVHDYIMIMQDDIILGDQFAEAINLLLPQLKKESVPMLQLFTYHIDLMSNEYGLHKTKPVSEEYYYLIDDFGERKPRIIKEFAAPNIYPRCYANIYSVRFALMLIKENIKSINPNADDMFLARSMIENKIPFHYVNPSFVYNNLLPRVQNNHGFEDFKKFFVTKVSALNHQPFKAEKLIYREKYFYPDLNLKELVIKWSNDKK